jgi:hypothetical protein
MVLNWLNCPPVLGWQRFLGLTDIGDGIKLAELPAGAWLAEIFAVHRYRLLRRIKKAAERDILI